MNPSDAFFLQMIMLATAATCWFVLRILVLYRQYQQLTQPQRPTAPLTVDTGPHEALPDAGAAHRRPPGFETTLETLARNAPSARYSIPLGWGFIDGRAVLSQAALVGDINHILLTAQSDGGKDSWATVALLSLIGLHTPAELQLCIIDGKGLDFVPWRGVPHVWRTALQPDAIAPAMQALSAERERRRRLLSAAGVSKWDTYPHGDLPLLVIYVSELSLLQDATSAKMLEQWLNSELAAGRAFGMRYIIATQTASNFATRWRSQISLYMAGFQPSQSQDTPNTGLRTQEIIRSGAVPPSALPAPPRGAGVFCAVHGRDAVNVRSTWLDDHERKHWLEAAVSASGASRHSDALEVLPAPLENGPNQPLFEGGSGEAIAVTAAERAAIIAAAREESSRRKVCQRVFGTTGGRSWEKVKVVCDAEGVLC